MIILGLMVGIGAGLQGQDPGTSGSAGGSSMGYNLESSQANSEERASITSFNIPVRSWELRPFSLQHFYPTYLADPLGNRFEAAYHNYLYGDIDHFDPVNQDGSYMGQLVIHPAVRFSLFRFSPASNPLLGVEIEIGVDVPVYMRSAGNDVIGMDGIYYFAVSGAPYEWLSLRFSKHHICTHVGDEYPYGKIRSVTDIDPNQANLPVRDDFILSAAARPLWFLGRPDLDILQVYGDFGFYLPGADFMGGRQNKPYSEAYLNLQGGIEAEYYFNREVFGGVFAAFNASAYQLNAFAPNLNFTMGYILPQDRDKQRFRIGWSYYNGRSIMNQFQHRRVRYWNIYLAMDI